MGPAGAEPDGRGAARLLGVPALRRHVLPGGPGGLAGASGLPARRGHAAAGRPGPARRVRAVRRAALGRHAELGGLDVQHRLGRAGAGGAGRAGACLAGRTRAAAAADRGGVRVERLRAGVHGGLWRGGAAAGRVSLAVARPAAVSADPGLRHPALPRAGGQCLGTAGRRMEPAGGTGRGDRRPGAAAAAAGGRPGGALGVGRAGRRRLPCPGRAGASAGGARRVSGRCPVGPGCPVLARGAVPGRDRPRPGAGGVGAADPAPRPAGCGHGRGCGGAGHPSRARAALP
jgi:hypothetical protein